MHHFRRRRTPTSSQPPVPATCSSWMRSPSGPPPGGSARAGPGRSTRYQLPLASSAWPSPVTRSLPDSRYWSFAPTTRAGSTVPAPRWPALSASARCPLPPPIPLSSGSRDGLALMPLTTAEVRRAPKVLLHDHLDGGLRPQTLIDIADQQGYRGLPATEPADLARWMTATAHRGHLELYLDAFRHT